MIKREGLMFSRIITMCFVFTLAASLYAKPLDTRITKLFFLGPDNSLFLEIVLEYDEKGNIVKSRQYDQFLRLLGVEEYFFDEKGNRLKEVTYDSSRQVEKYTLVEMKEGKRIRKSYNSDDILIMVMEDEYDKKGEIKTVTEYSVSNGVKNEVQTVSRYTRAGRNELKCLRTSPAGDTEYYYIIRFTDSGQINEVIYYNMEGTRSGCVRIFTEKGIMTEQSLDLVIY